MHYDYKTKLNKLDSQQYVNLRIPEIDWKLNEAYEIFIKSVAEPRGRSILGFESSQRTIDDLKTLVKKQFFANNQCLATTKLDDYSYRITVPTDYMFYTSARAIATKGTCVSKELVVDIVQDDDLSQESPFDNPSFEWRETNGLFYESGLIVKSDGSFSISHVCLNYIRKPLYIHNAQDMPGGTYKLPNNVTTLVGSQNCELPDHVHREIVDIAVLITTGDLISDYSIKQAKVRMAD